MSTDLFKHWWVALILGIAAIALGIMMFIYPLKTFVALSYVFAIFFLAYGIYTTVTTWTNRALIPAWGWSFAFGILVIIFGLMLFIPGMAPETFNYYVAFSVMFMGINNCAAAFSAKGFGDSMWIWWLILGILTVILAIIMIAHPLLSAGVVVIWAAVAMIMLGLSLIGLAYSMSKLNGIAKRS